MLKSDRDFYSTTSLKAEIHQIVKTTPVCQPVFHGTVGITGLVIQKDLLQIGIAVKAEGASVLFGEHPLEAEGPRVDFVLNPLTRQRADRFVVAVQSDIATIVKALQAHGQQESTNAIDHSESPSVNQAVILCLPGGAGKSFLGPLLALHMGIDCIVDPWPPSAPITPGALHLTNALPATLPSGVVVIRNA